MLCARVVFEEVATEICRHSKLWGQSFLDVDLHSSIKMKTDATYGAYEPYLVYGYPLKQLAMYYVLLMP